MRDFDLEAAFDSASDYAPILQYCAYGTCVENPTEDGERYCDTHTRQEATR